MFKNFIDYGEKLEILNSKLIMYWPFKIVQLKDKMLPVKHYFLPLIFKLNRLSF
ncbi:hypothetical protein FD20_GL002419 [Liquorilactobacillus uvarum DSM 19971]|uniref:Uncharacterized protein n=1 Tax=Liquorilactobacillus uvarum DSM 19971 TaxID=1423812 RepID=A0A0R1PZG0_9LACO|nr:hypothetical protein FD20_GL002419 [Liquorilactobacillus uvarum DSM 19971]